MFKISDTVVNISKSLKKQLIPITPSVFDKNLTSLAVDEI